MKINKRPIYHNKPLQLGAAAVAVVALGLFSAAVYAAVAPPDNTPVETAEAIERTFQKSQATADKKAAQHRQAEAEKKQDEAQVQAQAKTQIAQTPPPSDNNTVNNPVSGLPSSLLSLGGWKLTLPINNAEEIKQPTLAGYTHPSYFYVSGGGVVFRAPVGGSTTANSSYPRSELREMNGAAKAAWSNTSGSHSMTITQAITATPAVKPHVVSAQIHDGSDDVLMIRLEGSHLFAEVAGSSIGTLNPNYGLGQTFKVKLVASGGQIQVFYNGELKVTHVAAGSGWYFKAGVYTQSNTSKGDSPEAYGEVIIYSLSVSHT